MSDARIEKRFLDAVKQSNLVPPAELERALEFQRFAAGRGKALPLDRILLKFQLLDREQIDKLYKALRFFIWRKEDKVYAKLAVQSNLATAEDMKRCLKEQKRDFRERDLLRRVNEIAREKGLLEPKDDRAIVTALRKVKRRVTLVPLDGKPLYSGEGKLSGTGETRRGPAQKGEEERWRKEVRARELEELASGSRAEKPPVSDIGDPLGAPSPAFNTDEDLDPLWAEADLDDVVLDSEQREAARGTRGASRGSGSKGSSRGPKAKADESDDDTDIFDDLD